MGTLFSSIAIKDTIDKNRLDYDHCTTLLFMGGEWEEEAFLNVIETLTIGLAYDSRYSTHTKKFALYTGANLEELKYSRLFFKYFDYIKFGPYKKEYGGLDCKGTNQYMIQKLWKPIYLNETE